MEVIEVIELWKLLLLGWWWIVLFMYYMKDMEVIEFIGIIVMRIGGGF